MEMSGLTLRHHIGFEVATHAGVDLHGGGTRGANALAVIRCGLVSLDHIFHRFTPAHSTDARQPFAHQHIDDATAAEYCFHDGTTCFAIIDVTDQRSLYSPSGWACIAASAAGISSNGTTMTILPSLSTLFSR